MKLSVIIPVYNGGKSFEQCIEAITNASRIPEEIIVVDDASTDTSAATAGAAGTKVISIQGQPRGPAFARNRGAREAYGEILVFLDADVAVHKDTLSRIEAYFIDNPEVVAIFGSYDDNPRDSSFVSLYKNLQHHYVHQHSRREASTFWGGCGAIRHDIFRALGGFDEHYERPSIEDIELGRRLKQGAYRILLCPDIQVTHLKRWTFTGWLKADIFDRAVPWSTLILKEGTLQNDLNLDWQNRLSAIAAWMLVLFFVTGFFLPLLWVVAGCCVVAVVFINRNMYCFFTRKGGFFFALVAAFFHFLYFLYSSVTFALIAVRCKFIECPSNNKRDEKKNHY